MIVDLDAGEVTLPETPSTPLLPFEPGEVAELAQVLRQTLHPQLRRLGTLDVPGEDDADPRGSVRLQVPRVGELSVTATHAEAAVAASQEGHGLLRALSTQRGAASDSDASQDSDDDNSGSGNGGSNGSGDEGVGDEGKQVDRAGGDAATNTSTAEDGGGDGATASPTPPDDASPTASDDASPTASDDASPEPETVAVPVPPTARDQCAALRVFVLRPLMRLMCK